MGFWRKKKDLLPVKVEKDVVDLRLSCHDDRPYCIELEIDDGSIVYFNFNKLTMLKLAGEILCRFGMAKKREA